MQSLISVLLQTLDFKDYYTPRSHPITFSNLTLPAPTPAVPLVVSNFSGATLGLATGEEQAGVPAGGRPLMQV